MITVTKRDEVYLRVEADASIERELSDFFCFFPPNYEYSPAYTGKKWNPKTRRYLKVPRYWDGKIRLYNSANKGLYVGLLPHLLGFAAERGYDVDVDRDIGQKIGQLTETEALSFVGHLRLPHALQPEQFQALVLAAREGRQLFLSPTASGKSLISYLLARWFDKPTLVIVPLTSLVDQLFTDFEAYSVNNGWDVTGNCQKICEGSSKEVHTKIVISTWQAIYKEPAKWFSQFQVVIGDECHHFQAKSLETLMRKTVNAPVKIGLTGSIQETKVDKLVLEGLFGPVHQLARTRKLIDRGFLADLAVEVLVLKYPDHTRKVISKLPYQKEMEYVAQSPSRTKFIRDLTLSLQGNTLLLFHLVDKHGKIIYDAISAAAGPARKVFFIHGGVDADQRNEVRRIVEEEVDAVIVASYGVFSTGINIRNINNLVLASAFKSRIRNLQSIGRGLRRSETKTGCVLYDIADDFSWNGKANYSLKHLKKRLELYAEEEFDYRLQEVDVGAQSPHVLQAP